MAKCGVNLRQEDISVYINACLQISLDLKILPVLGILHDDTDETLGPCMQEFAPLNVVIYRCMSANSQLPIRNATNGGIPANTEIIGWNEHDDVQSFWDIWWQQVRAQRPDLKIHYGAPDVNNLWPRNDPLQAELDFADVHIGSSGFMPQPATIDGKTTVVTEIDIDPNRFTWGDDTSMKAAYDELLVQVEACLKLGLDVYVWGILAQAPDASISPYVIASLAGLNVKYANISIVAPAIPAAPITVQPKFNIGPGFLTTIKSLGWHPSGNEAYFSNQYSICECIEGILLYSNISNKVGSIKFN